MTTQEIIDEAMDLTFTGYAFNSPEFKDGLFCKDIKKAIHIALIRQREEIVKEIEKIEVPDVHDEVKEDPYAPPASWWKLVNTHWRDQRDAFIRKLKEI